MNRQHATKEAQIKLDYTKNAAVSAETWAKTKKKALAKQIKMIRDKQLLSC